MHWWNGDGYMGLMWIWWILGIALVVVLVWLFVRGGGGSAAGRESPEEILKRRYAGGEIDREEYERKLTELRQ